MDPTDAQILLDQSLGKGKGSVKRIKTYLHKEMNSNKYLSIDDYKLMNKQVKELKELESAYMNQSLT